MKKLYLLPRAERIKTDEFCEQKARPIVKKKRDMKTVWGILVICTVVLMCAAGSVAFISLGIACFILTFSKPPAKADLSGTRTKNILWNNIPSCVVGIALIFCGIIGCVSELGGSDGFTSKLLGKLVKVFFAIILFVFLVRLLQLIAATIALQKRKKRCTSPVTAEFIGYASHTTDISMNREAPPGVDPLFRYDYEALNYRFAVSEDSPLLEEIKDRFEIYIDPDQPDAYYHKEMSEDNKEIFINYLITVGLYIILPACFLIPIILF